MSRSSADTLRIALAPGEIALVRGQGMAAARRFTTSQRALPDLLPLLDEALADPEWHCRRAEVVVSQHFVRLVLTRPPGKALPRDEEQALVKASLRDIYGDTVEDWRLRVISQPPQFGLLGAAMDGAFLAQLEALLSRLGFRHVAIYPLASVAARRLPRQYAGWWVLVEPGWLSLFGGTNRVWQHLAAQPVDAGWAATLPGLIATAAELAPAVAASAAWIQGVGTDPAAVLESPDGDDFAWHRLPHDPAVRGALALLED